MVLGSRVEDGPDWIMFMNYNRFKAKRWRTPQNDSPIIYPRIEAAFIINRPMNIELIERKRMYLHNPYFALTMMWH